MPAGEAISARDRVEIDRAIRRAETMCRYEFSVYLGNAEAETRPFAQRLHASLVAPERSVLVLVDPSARILEIVTGSEVRRDLDDAHVRLTALNMQGAFANGDLVGGVARGVLSLAEHARRPETLHASN